MPASTPRLALPYPTPDDSVDVPRDVQALATKLDGNSAVGPPVVATPPAGAVEGQEVILSFVPTTTPAQTTRYLWHVRFVSGAWLPLGGESLAAFDASTPVVSGTGW